MIENTNTKQFYPGPILNNTLEITDFLFNDTEQIKIKHSKLNEEGILIDVDLNYSTDYEVTKVLPSDINAAEAALTASTGQVMLKNVNVLAGEKLTVYRVSQIIQDKDYPRTGAFPAATHEGALDYLTMQNQEQQEEIARSLKVPISTPNFNAAVPVPLPKRILRISNDAASFEFVPYDLDERLDTFEASVVDTITAGQEAIENSFEEFKNETNITINNIDTKVANAVDIANTANTKSDEAINIANTASAAATNAVNKSNSAVTLADTAVAIANNANIKSDEALLISQEAKEASVIAGEKATTTKEKVDIFEQDIKKVIEAADKIAQLESAVATAVQASESATKAAEDATQAAENAIVSLDSKLDIAGTAVKATADAEGNIITETYRTIVDSYNKDDVDTLLYNKANVAEVVSKSGDTITGSLTVQDKLYLGSDTKLGAIELWGGGSSNGGYIDFYNGSTTSDYTSRIIETAPGVITVQGASMKLQRNASRPYFNIIRTDVTKNEALSSSDVTWAGAVAFGYLDTNLSYVEHFCCNNISRVQLACSKDGSNFTTFAVGRDANNKQWFSHPQIISTYKSRDIGYRIWSDGYCEQWGAFMAKYEQDITVSLLKKFESDDYRIFTGPLGWRNIEDNINIVQRNTDSFIAYGTGIGGAGNWNQVGTWYWAAGYLASGQY